MSAPRNRGFTILELLLAMVIFLIICAAMFELLDLSQKKYNTETQLSEAYQNTRLAMDQITRDFNVSGYPPPGMFTTVPVSKPWTYAVGPVAWSPNYTSGTDCQIGVNCSTPGDYDLIIETHLSTDTADSNVSWIWYHLDTATNTLLREVVPKTAVDPYTAVSTANQAVPLLTNVMNNPGATLLGQIQTQNPTMYPGGNPQPIFQYMCDTPSGTLPCSSPLAVGYNTPRNIRDVVITLIVATPQIDLQTQRIKLVELSGRGHRLNPNG
jgi:prepilin-type N-terminal cleavage/methylation domain-containing protein